MSLQSRLSTLISAIGADVKELRSGWIATSVVLTYSSVDAPIFVVTTGSDLSSIIPVGAKLKLTQTTVKYFFVHAIDATTITLYGGTDYTLVNAAISLVSYSIMKAPVGFPLNPIKWTVEVSNANTCAKSSAVASTWYGSTGLSPTGPSIDIPIGCWRVHYQAAARALKSAASNTDATISLSTSATSESDPDFTAISWTGSSTATQIGSVHREKVLVLAAKTTYYLIVRETGGSLSSVAVDGATAKTFIRAVCAYL